MIAVSTDWHITDRNRDLMISLMEQQCAILNKLGIATLLVAGDIFESREAQRISALETFNEMLDIAENNSIKIVAIPGNHDKTVYTEELSFLRYFKHHPALTLIETNDTIFIGNFAVHLLPYFDYDCDNWNSNFNEIKENLSENKRNILIGHFSVDGSLNGNSKDKSIVGKTLLDDFDLVVLGHIHNKVKISENIHHIGSIKQKNFGEDSDKGLTIIDDKLNLELIKLNSPQYETIKVDLDITDYSDILKMVDTYKDNSNNIRFEISGEKSLVESFDVDILRKNNIKPLKRIGGIDVNLNTSVKITSETFEYSKDDIRDRFKKFCEEKGLELEQGEYLLDKIL